MNTYSIYIKSHTDAPDFELEMQANNFVELKAQFQKQYEYDLTEKDVEEFKLCMKCGEEVGSSLVGDESVEICRSCGFINYE